LARPNAPILSRISAIASCPAIDATISMVTPMRGAAKAAMATKIAP